MTLLSLATNGTTTLRVDIDGTALGGSYTAAEVLAALNTHRFEVFRYEQHHIGSSGWELVGPFRGVHSAKVKYDRWATGSMRSAEIELVDPPVFGTSIDDLGDALRCFRLLEMPDGAFVQWCRGTFYVPSPEIPLEPSGIVRLECPDALKNLVDAKLPDWLTVPATADMAAFYGHTDDLDDPVRWAISLIEYFYPFAGVFIDADPDERRIPSSLVMSFRPGDAVLDIVNQLLYSVGHADLVADVFGSYVSGPFVKPSALTTDFSYIAAKPIDYPSAACILVSRSWKYRRDLFEAYNSWTGVVSAADLEFSYTKTIPDSPPNELSPAARGRTVRDVFYSHAPDAAALQLQVDRKFEEGQHILAELDGNVAAMPHDHRDKVAIVYPTQPWSSLGRLCIVKGWEEPLKAGAPMTLHLAQSPLTTSDGDPAS